jgi:uncharacterized protein YciI
MADYYLVQTCRGPRWDRTLDRREQRGWDAHATFMDHLVEDGFVIMGGPVGDVDGDQALLVVDAESEAAVRARLARDPWAGGVLRVESIRPWTIWLRSGEER